jgi:hypothetical protein
MTSAKGVGIPIKLMHEAEGHVITVRDLGCLDHICSLAFSGPAPCL